MSEQWFFAGTWAETFTINGHCLTFDSVIFELSILIWRKVHGKNWILLNTSVSNLWLAIRNGFPLRCEENATYWHKVLSFQCFRTHDGLAIQICKSCPMTFKKMVQWEKHAKKCQGGAPLQPPNVSSAFSTHSPVVRSPRAQMCTPLKQSTPKQSNR